MNFSIQTFIQIIGFLLLSLSLPACASKPHLKEELIRPWNTQLYGEYPDKTSVIAYYQKKEHELLYLAARHTTAFGSDTLNLVERLFRENRFEVLIIESIPYSSGESPRWFVDEAKKGRSEKFILGGESALAVIFADEKNIPFYAGEPDHQDIYKGLKAAGYSDLDFLGFYTVRQIPQWIRQNKDPKTLFVKEIPGFLEHYCKILALSQCHTKADVLGWYRKKMNAELTPDVFNEVVAPLSDGTLFTQKISSKVGEIRDRFTLKIIEAMLDRYKRVAVIYGASHLVTLRKSFDEYFGAPQFTEDKK